MTWKGLHSIMTVGLLVTIGAASSESSDAPAQDVGEIRGQIRLGRDPARFANVTLSGTRKGAQADPNGRFKIENVPTGRYALRAVLAGYSKFILVDVEPQRVTRVDLNLKARSKPHDAQFHPRIVTRVGRVTHARVFRMTGKHSCDGRDTAQCLAGGWTILREANPPGDTWTKELKQLLSRKYSNEPKLCEISPGVGVRLYGAGEPIDVVICYECAILQVRSGETLWSGGNFDRQVRAFTRLAKEAFPDDLKIQALKER